MNKKIARDARSNRLIMYLSSHPHHTVTLTELQMPPKAAKFVQITFWQLNLLNEKRRKCSHQELQLLGREATVNSFFYNITLFKSIPSVQGGNLTEN